MITDQKLICLQLKYSINTILSGLNTLTIMRIRILLTPEPEQLMLVNFGSLLS